MISGTIPPASGLSSSSALVVAGAMTTLVMSQNLDRLSRSQLADLCAKSERFIGTQGGGNCMFRLLYAAKIFQMKYSFFISVFLLFAFMYDNHYTN